MDFFFQVLAYVYIVQLHITRNKKSISLGKKGNQFYFIQEAQMVLTADDKSHALQVYSASVSLCLLPLLQVHSNPKFKKTAGL